MSQETEFPVTKLWNISLSRPYWQYKRRETRKRSGITFRIEYSTCYSRRRNPACDNGNGNAATQDSQSQRTALSIWHEMRLDWRVLTWLPISSNYEEAFKKAKEDIEIFDYTTGVLTLVDVDFIVYRNTSLSVKCWSGRLNLNVSGVLQNALILCGCHKINLSAFVLRHLVKFSAMWLSPDILLSQTPEYLQNHFQ